MQERYDYVGVSLTEKKNETGKNERRLKPEKLIINVKILFQDIS